MVWVFKLVKLLINWKKLILDSVEKILKVSQGSPNIRDAILNNEIDLIIEMFFEDVLINIMITNIFFIRLFLSDISTIYYNNYINRISNFIQVIHFKLAIFLIMFDH